MDIMELGAIGELVGGIAVIGSLLYVGIQVRQSARAQQQANDLAKAGALQMSVSTYSTARQMLFEETMGAIWIKAVNDEELDSIEELRLFVLLQELTYSAVAALANNVAVGNEALAETTPGVVARYAGQSRTTRRVWKPLASELTENGLGDFATSIARLLAEQEGRV